MLDKFFDNMREQHLTRLLADQPGIEQKTYSEEDLRKAVTMARTFCKTEDGEGYDEYQYTPAEIIQSIKQQ